MRDKLPQANIWLRGQAVKTLASHAGIRGSIPLGVTEKARFYGLFSCLENESAPNVRLGIEESKMFKEEAWKEIDEI